LNRLDPPNPGADETAAESSRRGGHGEFQSHAASNCDRRLDQLIDRLPHRFRSTVRWLRQPSSRRIRIPAGISLICGGALGFLPVLGFWMIPVGLILLADDVPLLRSIRSRILNWIERRHPQWLAASAAQHTEDI
jgi:hypothetical protein